MRRSVLIFGALGLLVATTMVATLSTDDSPHTRFCQLYAIVTYRSVELDGKRFALAGASAEPELRHGCNHFAGPVILPNCDAWEVDSADRKPHVTGKVGPFYSDGTCDGSQGGTLLDNAPTITVTDANNGGRSG